jgi:hypothetical protein
MRELRRPPLRLAVLALLVLLAAGFALAVLRRPHEPPVRLLGRPIAVVKSLSPQDPQFGDTVVAKVDVYTDPHRVDPRTVRVVTSFRPYRVASRTRTLSTQGGVSVTHVEARLRCLEVACVPTGQAAGFRFAPVRIGYRDGAGAASLVAKWSPLRVHSRVTAADLLHPRLRVPPANGVSSGYRLPPAATGYALLVLSGLFALAGAWLLLRVALGRVRGRSATALERILAELASGNGDAGRRRRALDELARALEPVDESLSTESRALAWAPHDPRPDAVLDLTTRVRAAVAR